MQYVSKIEALFTFSIHRNPRSFSSKFTAKSFTLQRLIPEHLQRGICNTTRKPAKIYILFFGDSPSLTWAAYRVSQLKWLLCISCHRAPEKSGRFISWRYDVLWRKQAIFTAMRSSKKDKNSGGPLDTNLANLQTDVWVWKANLGKLLLRPAVCTGRDIVLTSAIVKLACPKLE